MSIVASTGYCIEVVGKEGQGELAAARLAIDTLTICPPIGQVVHH